MYLFRKICCVATNHAKSIAICVCISRVIIIIVGCIFFKQDVKLNALIQHTAFMVCGVIIIATMFLISLDFFNK